MNHSTTADLDTGIGSYCFRASAATLPGSVLHLVLRVVELDPSALRELAVMRLRAVLLQASSDRGFETLDYGVCCEGGIACGPASGEFLDAQIWTGLNQIVVVGTEDGEMLASRLATLFAAGASPAELQYRANGMSVSLAQVPAGCPVTLHYLVAENGKSDSEQCAAWDAVSLPHEQISARVRRC